MIIIGSSIIIRPILVVQLQQSVCCMSVCPDYNLQTKLLLSLTFGMMFYHELIKI